jgi:hypothetical protein
MTSEAFREAQRLIELRLSTHRPARTPEWAEWAAALRGRHAAVCLYTLSGDRPSCDSAVALAADAIALVAAVIESEDCDVSSGEAA